MNDMALAKPIRKFSTLSILQSGILGAALWMGTVWWVHAHNPRALFSTHGLLHSAVVQQIRLDSLPPENPFYANEPVCYYWFFHAVGAIVANLTGTDPLHALESVIIASLLVLFVAATALGVRMYGSRVAGVFMGCLALIGGNPLGPIIWMIKRIIEGSGVFNPDPEAVFGSYIYRSQIGQRLFGPNWPYFFNITSRPVALAGVLVMLLALHRYVGSRRVSDACLIILSTFLTTAISPIVGGAAAVALAAAMVMEPFFFRGKHTTESTATRVRRGLITAVLLGVGVILSIPTYWSMLEHGQGGTKFVLFSYLGIKSLVAVLVGAGPILCMVVLVLHRRSADFAFQFVCCLAAGMLFLGAIAIELPVENSCNLYHAAVILLACPAAALILDATAKSNTRLRWPRMLLLFALLPTAILIANAYAGRAPLDAGFGKGGLVRLPLDSDRSRLYQWLQTQSPKNAIIATDPRVRVALTGNVSELPAFSGRVMFIGSSGYMTDPYPDAERRRRIAIDLVSAQPLNAEDSEFLQSLGRPVLIVLETASSHEIQNALTDLYGPAEFSAETVAAFFWTKPQKE